MCGCLSRAPLPGTWPETQACALTGNQTGNPLVCRPALNPLSYTSQAKIISFIDFRERGREGEGEGKKHQRVVASHLACNPSMYPDWELNQRPFGSQAGTQSTEPHQPGSILFYSFFFFFLFFFKISIYLFIFRGEGEGEREGEKHQYVVAFCTPPTGTWPTTQACTLTRN